MASIRPFGFGPPFGCGNGAGRGSLTQTRSSVLLAYLKFRVNPRFNFETKRVDVRREFYDNDRVMLLTSEYADNVVLRGQAARWRVKIDLTCIATQLCFLEIISLDSP